MYVHAAVCHMQLYMQLFCAAVQLYVCAYGSLRYVSANRSSQYQTQLMEQRVDTQILHMRMPWLRVTGQAS
jgi:hypothetical protein